MLIYRMVGGLYLLSGLWCAFKPELAAEFLGFGLAIPTGLVEFVAVYGGLQAGIALAIFLTSQSEHYAGGGMLYTLILSSSLVAFRLYAILAGGASPALVAMLLLEIVLLVLIAYVFIKHRSQSRSV